MPKPVYEYQQATRPDGLRTLWIEPKDKVVTKEHKSKIIDVAEELSEKCGWIGVSFQSDQFQIAKGGKVFQDSDVMEIVSNPKCSAETVLAVAKQHLGGKWVKTQGGFGGPPKIG